MFASFPSQRASFVSATTWASGLPVWAAPFRSVFARIMNIAAGTPFPLTSATRKTSVFGPVK